MKKRLGKYNLSEINEALYCNKLFENLWLTEKQEAKQLFLNHSDEQPKMFDIPSVWVPMVKHLMEKLIKVDPGIRFLQVKEKLGELRVYIKTLAIHHDLVHHMIYGASKAVDTVTLIQLRMLDRIKDDTA